MMNAGMDNAAMSIAWIVGVALTWAVIGLCVIRNRKAR
jgi:hypothetical protein